MIPFTAPPMIELTVAGARVAPALLRGLQEVQVSQRLQAPAQCELGFAVPPGAGGVPLAIGDRFSIGVAGAGEPLFSGEVTAVQDAYEVHCGRAVRVRGYDALHRLRRRQPLRAHLQVTLADLAAELVADLGLEVEADDPGPLWERLLQMGQDDLELLEETAERSGLHFAVHDGVLSLLTLDGCGEPLPLRLGDTLLEAVVEVNADRACRGVEALGWDPPRALARRGEAATPRVGRSASASADAGLASGDGRLRLTGAAVHDQRQAEALAQGALDRRVAAEVVLRGTAEGDPALRPGAVVEVRGLAAEHDGRYVLTAVTHTIDARRGFVSRLDTTPPAPRARAVPRVASLGLVSRIDDPDRIGRVQVSLPACGDLESGWLEVITAGAGSGKGLVATPDVGDRVLVLFPDGDPARGVVIGGLYGADGPFDSGIEGGAVRRFTVRTPGGQRVVLDDHQDLVRIENKCGSFVELAPKHVLVHAHGAPLTIEAPGQTVSIRGNLIDFAKA
jgi:phage baseplate assembly protein gpV/phage protein D